MYSVIIPVYNGEKTLTETVLSVINQTVKADEILIIDDCSTDNTYELMKSLSTEYANIKVFRNSENINVADTRNHGFKLANCEYVALLDADDVWDSQKIEKQLSIMKKTGCDICYTGYSLMDIDGVPFGAAFSVPDQVSFKELLKTNYIGCATVIMKKEIVKKFKMRKDYSHEDYVFWLEILSAGYRACGVNEPLVKYRVYKDSRSGDKVLAAKNRWKIYRKFLKLNFFSSLYYFAIYAIRAMKKYNTLGVK